MRIALIASTADSASSNIASQLQPLPKNVELLTIAQEPIHADHIDRTTDAEALIFLSKHASTAGVRALTVHPLGNFGGAAFGGSKGTLVPAPALLMKRLFLELQQHNTLGCPVELEATHHGPKLEKPACFVEIGSSPAQWADKKAGGIVAAAIAAAFSTPVATFPVAIGLGGPHYTPRFRSIMEGNHYALAHVCAKHNLPQLTPELVRQALQQSVPAAGRVFLDKKGLGSEKQRILKLLDTMDQPWEML